MRPRTALRAAITAVIVLPSAACSLQPKLTLPPLNASASQGGTITVAIGRPGSIDPTNAYEPNGELVVRTMCDTLVEQNPKTGNLYGALAESFQTTDTGARFIVRLRKNMRFSDGSRVTADDVVATLSRLASADNASFRQNLPVLIDGFDIISGAKESKNEQAHTKLTGLNVLDGRTFEIRLRKDPTGLVQFRMPDYIRFLAEAATAPVPRSIIRNNPDSLEHNPICAGPYRLAEPWNGGDTIHLVRNERYTPANAGYTGGGRGYAHDIIFRIYPTAAAEVAAFRSGDVDIAPLDQSGFTQLRATAPADVVAGQSRAMQYIGVTADTGTFANAQVRQALSLAVNRTDIASSIFGGLAAPATGFYPPALGDWIYRKNACDPTANPGRLAIKPDSPRSQINVVPPVAQVDAGRQLLASAGVSLKGVTVPLVYNTDGDNAALARLIAAEWSAAYGLEVKLMPMSWDSYLQRAVSPQGMNGAFLESWAPDYVGPDQYVGPLFTAASTQQANWAHFQAPGLDDTLLRYIRANEEIKDQATAYQSVERYLCASMPLVPLTFAERAFAVSTSRLGTATGAWLHRSTGSILLREVFVKGAHA